MLRKLNKIWIKKITCHIYCNPSFHFNGSSTSGSRQTCCEFTTHPPLTQSDRTGCEHSLTIGSIVTAVSDLLSSCYSNRFTIRIYNTTYLIFIFQVRICGLEIISDNQALNIVTNYLTHLYVSECVCCLLYTSRCV